MTDTSAPVVCVLVDALRHDYLNRPETPNLTRLAHQADMVSVPIRPILGYSDSIRAVIFTGQYPEDSGYWMEYCYRPESSPWTNLRHWTSIDKLPSDFLQRVVKFAASGTILKRRAAADQLPHLHLRHVPMRAIDRFDLNLRQQMTEPNAMAVPTIFDASRTAGRAAAYLSTTQLRPSALLGQLDRLPADVGLVFVYIHQIDMSSHVFGLHHNRFHRALRDADALVGEIATRVNRKFPTAPLVVLADHGMSTIRRQISLQGLAEHPAFPNRMMVALDATMARLWFFDDDENLRSWARDYITQRLPGRFLDDGDRRELRLRFDNDLYGEEIFLTNPGWAIFPNFHSYLRPKAMHAYHPDDREQWGAFIGSAGLVGAREAPLEMTEIAPMVRRHLGVPSPVGL